MTALDEIWCFLTDQGYELEEGHIVRHSSDTVLAEHLGNAMNDCETWLVVVHKLYGPKSPSVKRMVNRRTGPGLRLEWGDGSDD
jgi:hypothetical protein